jgi:hypothetical protein
MVTVAPGKDRVGEMVRASRLLRELEASYSDPREPIARKIRRFQSVRSPELPPLVRALRFNDPAWAALFAAEAARLHAMLGDAVARLEHFGSSAVPAAGLSSKNAIDFLIAMRGPAAARRARRARLHGLRRRAVRSGDRVVVADRRRRGRLRRPPLRCR